MTAPARLPDNVHALRRGWQREKHVLKHLYRWTERWDFIVEGLPSHLRERALQAGCSLIDRVQRGSERRELVAPSCRQLLQKDHDAFYMPTYMRSVDTARARGRAKSLGPSSGRLFLVGDNGVLVVVTEGFDQRPSRVLSAYRYHGLPPEQHRPEKFVEAAVDYWRDKKVLSEGALAKARALQDDEESP
ncbi:MAG TPA: hypothetical protein VFZ09_03035 [Archangium sp.]|uniref:hypothetical protein n=1 Tax=Archangium sp. TaxID=1872627 RepID=UPI002E2F9F6F|nr:hypothetical protein [Archangium sp.]HEX5745189.1 hypothetical protein [Archangium sp.]